MKALSARRSRMPAAPRPHAGLPLRLLLPFTLVLAALVAHPGAAPGSTITIINMDGPGEGFNDTHAAAPVGGNTGTTVGQQRLIVFQTAANYWASLLPSAVEIRVEANFDTLACTATSGVLGSAGPIGANADFTGAEWPGTWYHSALANKRAGIDLTPGSDDISAHFNSKIGTTGCLSTAPWYYGLDGNEGSGIDLLSVVLHELGHGLGFSTLINVSTGAELSGMPDVFSRFILDTTVGLHWSDMTDAQRQASAVNTGNLVWDGNATSAESRFFLSHRPELVVNTPASLAGLYAVGTASFGGALTQTGLTSTVVLAVDGTAPTSDACSPLVNGAQMSGKIALIDRGTCTFTAKAKAAQNAGAIAAIIVDNTVSSTPPSLGGTDTTVTIPTIGVTKAVGDSLRAHLAGGVSVTLRLDPNYLAGANQAGQLLLYTPNPVQVGSSISHWDVSATPNLLMEPVINSDLQPGNVDETHYAFEDIGWLAHTTSVGDARPVASHLDRNAPNPFRPSTRIHFELAAAGPAVLDVFDLNGRLVRRLVDGALGAGGHSVRWDGKDQAGRRVGAGVYMYRLQAGTYSESRRMMLLE